MCNIDIQKSNNNPWIDIASYQIDDAFRFKGREEDVEKFLKIVNYNIYLHHHLNQQIQNLFY